jgi:hypothetical protein
MVRRRPVIHWQVTAAHPVVVGNTRVTLQSRTLVVGWSFLGVVWRHPTAALVEADGRVTHMPIHDVTRLVELGLLGLGLVILMVMVSIRRKEHVS